MSLKNINTLYLKKAQCYLQAYFHYCIVIQLYSWQLFDGYLLAEEGWIVMVVRSHEVANNRSLKTEQKVIGLTGFFTSFLYHYIYIQFIMTNLDYQKYLMKF